MPFADIISHAAQRLNPLVTAWDDAWRPARIDFEDGACLSGIPGALAIPADSTDPDRAAVTAATLDAFALDEFRLPLPAGELRCGRRSLIMGIVNVTPDSFSDGGRYFARDRAVARALDLVEQGAHVIDIGGESTRPGAEPVPPEEERRRTEPVVAELATRCSVPISIDTAKATVAAAALAAGASIVNDVTALSDPDMAPAVARAGAALVLMHMQGAPRTMQKNPAYRNVLREIALYLRRRIARAVDAGVDPERIIIDPGIGFGKTLAHNAEIIRRLPVLASLGRPILVGCSRKSLIERALGLPVDRRLHASIALNVLSTSRRASIIRVHDVREAVEAAAMTDAVLFGNRRDP